MVENAGQSWLEGWASAAPSSRRFWQAMDRHSPTVKWLRDQMLTPDGFPRCCDAATKTLHGVSLNRREKVHENARYRVWQQHIASFRAVMFLMSRNWHSKCFSPGRLLRTLV